MAFKVGDEVESKHELKNCGTLRTTKVPKGKKGKVRKVGSGWANKIEVEFDLGWGSKTKCEVTADDIKEPGWFS
jgi:hypothetical protein